MCSRVTSRVPDWQSNFMGRLLVPAASQVASRPLLEMHCQIYQCCLLVPSAASVACGGLLTELALSLQTRCRCLIECDVVSLCALLLGGRAQLLTWGELPQWWADIMMILMRQQWFQRRFMGFLSQLRVRYLHSDLTTECAPGSPTAGYRAPDVTLQPSAAGPAALDAKPARLFQLLRGTHHTLRAGRCAGARGRGATGALRRAAAHRLCRVRRRRGGKARRRARQRRRNKRRGVDRRGEQRRARRRRARRQGDVV